MATSLNEMVHDAVTVTSHLPPDALGPLVSVFYAAFASKAHHVMLLTGDEGRVHQMLEASINTRSALYAVHGERLVGVLGYQRPGDRPFVDFGWPTLRRTFGLWGALWRWPWIQLLNSETHPPDALYIAAISIDESMRGRGVGSQLIAEAERMARAWGLKRLALNVVDTNPSAMKLYARLGFVTVREQRYPWLPKAAGFKGVFSMEKPLD